jgi:SNF2 family DNA or RNA helicase
MNGKMPIKSREVQLKEFENEEDTKILIASMKTGGSGLNLTMANKCIIYDLWWNEAMEQQVSDLGILQCFDSAPKRLPHKFDSTVSD